MVVQWEDRFHAGNRAHTYLGPVDHPEATGQGEGDLPEVTYPDFVDDRQGLRRRGPADPPEGRGRRRPQGDDRPPRPLRARRPRPLPGARPADDPGGRDGPRHHQELTATDPDSDRVEERNEHRDRRHAPGPVEPATPPAAAAASRPRPPDHPPWPMPLAVYEKIVEVGHPGRGRRPPRLPLGREALRPHDHRPAARRSPSRTSTTRSEPWDSSATTPRPRLPMAFRLADSAPQPDVKVVRGRSKDYNPRMPTTADVPLVVEVADSTAPEGSRPRRELRHRGDPRLLAR